MHKETILIIPIHVVKICHDVYDLVHIVDNRMRETVDIHVGEQIHIQFDPLFTCQRLHN